MKITVLCVGKIKESFYREAVSEYSKRLGRYTRLDIVEVADEKTPDGASAAEEEKIMKLEGERLIAKIPAGAYVVTLEIAGQMMDSVMFSERISALTLQSESHLCFIIGGSLGLAPEVRALAKWKLSFSKMTFPHQLMRVILLEQIYRAFRIRAGEPYHK